jgi:hypothetical protein
VFLQVVPAGQQSPYDPEQHTAFGYGQQPIPVALKL